MDFVSSKSPAYRALVRAGGPEGRNCEGDVITQGVMVANWGPAPGSSPGGVGRHSPTEVPPRNGGGGGAKPSVLRHAQIASATVCPHSIPRATEWPPNSGSLSVMASSEASRFASKVLVWAAAPAHRRPSGAGAAVLEDLGSKNGTFVRGTRIGDPTPLADGDEIFLGEVALVFRMSPRNATTRSAVRAGS